MKIDQKNNSNFVRAYEFEQFCFSLIKSQKFSPHKDLLNIISEYYPQNIDFIFNDPRNCKVAVSVKYYQTGIPNILMLRKAAEKLIAESVKLNIKKALLIVSVPISSEEKEAFENSYKIRILDANSIMYLIRSNDESIRTLLSLMNETFDTSDIKWEEHKFSFNYIEDFKESHVLNGNQQPEKSEGEKLIEELISLPSGIDSYKKYEELCVKILKFLFIENLINWSNQCTTDDDLCRFDLVCRIKSKNDFWNLLVHSFNSRYVIFEFKNYNDLIKQTQVFTTEKYLFKTALRNVGFIVSRKGLSDNALSASKGILRENGKLIIDINDAALINMINMKESGGEPSDYLFEILDNLLMKIEK